MGYIRSLEKLCSVLDLWPGDDADELPKLPEGMEWKILKMISGDQYIVDYGGSGLYISGKEWFAKKYGRKERVVEDMKQQFTVTPDGNMTYHGDKPIHVGVGVIFNTGDTLVRAVEESELCGANESLVNINPKVVEPVDESKSPDWIEWEGGECPVDGDLEVVIRLRDGRELTSEAGVTDGFVWSHSVESWDYEIIAYRPNYPKFLVNPMKDDGITDHEMDEPVEYKQDCCCDETGPCKMHGDMEDESEWVDGLPPVGALCELAKSTKITNSMDIREFRAGTRVRIGGHARFFDNGAAVAAFIADKTHFTGTATASMFRPIKSDKEKAIEGIANIIRYSGTNNGEKTLLEIQKNTAEEIYSKFCSKQESDDE